MKKTIAIAIHSHLRHAYTPERKAPAHANEYIYTIHDTLTHTVHEYYVHGEKRRYMREGDSTYTAGHTCMYVYLRKSSIELRMNLKPMIL